MFEAHFIRVTCPECSKPIRRSVCRVKARERVTCRGCGYVVALDTPEGRALIQDADYQRAALIARQRIGRDGKIA